MDFQDIQKLIQTFDSTGLTRLNYTNGAVSITLEKGTSVSTDVVNTTQRNTYTAAPKTEEIVSAVPQENINYQEPVSTKAISSEDYLKAPMVGVFYLSPSPEEAPYVGVGQRVKKGQVLCILEAMKVMNEIQAEWDGVVENILVEPEQIVEYGQPLFQIRRD